MVRFRFLSLFFGSAVFCAAALLFGAANAQIEQRRIQSRTLDIQNQVLRLPEAEITPGLIDFENVEGPQSGVGVALTTQYRESHGVSFGRGASVHYCARSTDDVMASLCAYQSAASGRRAAVHDVRAGGPAMVMTFDRPVEAITMRINPTGGVMDEAFIARVSGFDADGKEIVQEDTQFNWYQDAFAWPTSVGFKTDGAEIARATVQLLRVSVNNRPVRYLIDDLPLGYTPERTLPPVAAALAEETAPPRSDARVVQSARQGSFRDELRIYPVATRKRAAIDWDAVDAAMAEQNALGLAAASYQGQGFVDAAELPVLLPSTADAGSLIVVGNADSYTAHFTTGGRAYSLYGSRLLTVMRPAQGAVADQTNLTLMRTDEALIGSFVLYGASYSLTRHCIDESAADDSACHDADSMGDVAASLVVVVGDAGRGRP